MALASLIIIIFYRIYIFPSPSAPLAVLHDRCSQAPVLPSGCDGKGPGACARRPAWEWSSRRHPGRSLDPEHSPPTPTSCRSVTGALTDHQPHPSPKAVPRNSDHPTVSHTTAGTQGTAHPHSPQPTSKPAPDLLVPHTHPRPQPESLALTESPHHPSPEPAAPRQILWVAGSGPRTRLPKCPRWWWTLSRNPTPHFSFLRKLLHLASQEGRSSSPASEPKPAPA